MIYSGLNFVSNLIYFYAQNGGLKNSVKQFITELKQYSILLPTGTESSLTE